MPIAINGSGTVTGVSVGGLPDGIVDNDMIANSTIAEAKLAANVNTITMVDEWRVTANFTPSQASTVDSNWERNDTVFSQIGTGMTESSGIFTFPQTGIYKITVFFGGFVSGSSSYSGVQLRISNDSGSSYSNYGASYQATTAGPTNPHFNGNIHYLLDVTNTSTYKLKLLIDRSATATYFGGTGGNFTGIQFVRLGDT